MLIKSESDLWLQSKVGFFFYVRAGISMAPSDAGGLDAVQNRTLPHYTEWCIEVRPYCLTNWNLKTTIL